MIPLQHQLELMTHLCPLTSDLRRVIDMTRQDRFAMRSAFGNCALFLLYSFHIEVPSGSSFASCVISSSVGTRESWLKKASDIGRWLEWPLEQKEGGKQDVFCAWLAAIRESELLSSPAVNDSSKAVLAIVFQAAVTASVSRCMCHGGQSAQNHRLGQTSSVSICLSSQGRVGITICSFSRVESDMAPFDGRQYASDAEYLISLKIVK